MADFVHLHVHSDYSFLDGGAKVSGLAQRAAKLGLSSLALTDHGVMCGVLEFHKECKKAGVKPIIGCEIYVVPFDMTQKSDPNLASSPGIKQKDYAHLVLLAENETGYKNLCKIVSKAHTRGFYRKPRADHATLAQHKEGLVALSACLAGEVPQALMHGQDDKPARTKIEQYLEIFGRDNFFLEVQAHRDSFSGEQEALVAKRMFEVADSMKVRTVLTNDSHYLTAEDFQAHNALLCINWGRMLNDPDRPEYGPDFYLKDAAEMAALFPQRPDLVQATLDIGKRCNFDFGKTSFHLPEFKWTEGVSPREYLRKKVEAGVKKLYGENALAKGTITGDRLEFELSVIEKMGFNSYFLIVADFIQWAKDREIPVGPGRGSAAGSIVAYALGITGLDPIKYNLLFERFLNPDRVSMPDIDIDFCVERRGEVIEYVRNKYGDESVCQIGTFGKLLARAAVKDAGRVLGVPLQKVNALTKLIPVMQGKVKPLDECLKEIPEFKQQYESDEETRKLVDTARSIEGLNRGTGVHAAGVVISDADVTNYMPLMRQEGSDGEVVIATQYNMSEVEAQGLLKMDFLGLRNLTIIDQALRVIEKNTGLRIELDPTKVPADAPYKSLHTLDDAATYKTLSAGEGFGVFQVESEGMCRLMQAIKPSTFEDISAVLAIYRPGPLAAGVDKEFAARKHGRVKVTMPGENEGIANAEAVSRLKEILSDTYGTLIYQEQAMLISRRLAGFTPGDADKLRKAIGKKKKEEMDVIRPKFIEGCEKSGFSKKLGEHLWQQIEGFGAYGFNKAHTVAYGLITYQTGWLKTHYPSEYAAALLTSQIGNNDKIVEGIRNVRAMGLKVVPPDINLSDATFSARDGTVVFGLSGMKGVGTKAVEKIIEGRNKVKAFKGFLHFLENVDLTHINKAVLESLVKGGAFDSFGLNRRALLEGLESALKVCAEAAADRLRGQKGLFGGKAKQEPDEKARDLALLPKVPELSESERQRAERETFGFYISSSPLDTHRELFAKFAKYDSKSLLGLKPGCAVVIGGLISGLSVNTVKNESSRNFGKKMAKFDLADASGITKVTVFPDTYEKFQSVIQEDAPVFVRGITEATQIQATAPAGEEEGEDVQEQVAVTVSEIIHVQDAEQKLSADEGLAFDEDFKTFTDTTPEDLATLTEPVRVRIGGVVNKLRTGTSKRGNEYANFVLIGPKGAFKVVVFQELAKAWAGRLKEGAALFVVGEANKEDDGKVVTRADALVPAAGAREKFTKAVCLQLTVSQIHDEVLGNLSELALQHAGPTPLFFKVLGEDGAELELIEAAPDFRVKPTPDFILGVKKLIPGSDVIVAAN